MISGTLRYSVEICRLEQMTFNKYRKYNYKNKHMHDKICYITQSKKSSAHPMDDPLLQSAGKGIYTYDLDY